MEPVQSKGLDLNGENNNSVTSINSVVVSIAAEGAASRDVKQRLAAFAERYNSRILEFSSEADLKAKLPIDAMGIVVLFQQVGLGDQVGLGGTARRSEDLKQSPQCRIVVTSEADVSQVVAALHAGVHAVIEPTASAEVWDQTLTSAMEEAAVRKSHYMARKAMTGILNKMTEGELLVLRAVVDGQLNKRIAKRLEISERTVEARRKRIFEKTETTSVAMLVRLIVESIGIAGLYRKCEERCEAKLGGPPQPHLSISSKSGDHSLNDSQSFQK